MARKNRKHVSIILKLYSLIPILLTYLHTKNIVLKYFNMSVMGYVTFRVTFCDAYLAFNNSAIVIQINLIFYTGLLISFNKLYTKFNNPIIYHLPVIDFLKMLLL